MQFDVPPGILLGRMRDRLRHAGAPSWLQRLTQKARQARPSSSPEDPHLLLRRIARLCAGWACLEGLVVLSAWILGAGRFTSLLPGLPPMFPNTAIMAVLSGISLFLQLPLRSDRGAFRLARAAAAAAGFLAVLNLSVHAFGAFTIPVLGLSSLQTTISFLLLGAAFLAFDVRTARGHRPAEGLALAAGSVVIVASLGILFNAELLYGTPALLPWIGMSLPTMAALFALSLGVLLARPDVGLMATLTSAYTGGAVARRLTLGLAGFAPFALLIGLGTRLGWYEAPIAITLIVFLGIVEGAAVILTTGARLNQAAETQRRVEQRARELFEQASDGIFIADLDGRYLDVNAAGCRLLGFTHEEILGRTIMDLIPAEDAPRLARVKVEELLRQKTHLGEWRLRRKDGSYLLAEVSAKILPDGRWQGFVRDISERRRAEEELRKHRERERYQLALEAAARAIVVVDKEGRIVFVNGEAERLFGWTREELTGRIVDLLVPEGLRAAHRSHRDDFFRESTGRRVMGEGRELLSVRKDGSLFPVEISLTRVQEAGEEFVVASITDISVRKVAEKALRESEERFRLLVQGTRDYAIFMHDPEGRITVWNEGAARILGYRADEILGERYHRFYLPEEVAAGKPDLDLRAAVEKGSFEDEGWRVRKDGSRFWAGALITPIVGPDREILGYGKVVRDLTERRKGEEELKSSEARLRQSVLELERFAYTISHDLRSPLRALQGYSHFLSERLAERADPESKSMLQRMGAAAERLDHLIRDLLSYSAIARAEIHLEEVDLGEILDHVAGHYPELTKACLRVQAPLGRVRGQPSLLIQVLSNLLDNAVKFVPQNRTPEIDVWTERREKGWILLVVQDNGIGIPPEAWGKIFQPFTRLNPSGEGERTGIGLAIVETAVKRMGGRVSLESELGKGSRFRVELQEA